MNRQTELILGMAKYEEKNVHRINHFLKVLSFAKAIGEGEDLDEEQMEILETAAIVHDIGIKPSMEQLGNSNGPNQEKLGAPIASEMLKRLGYSDSIADRVSYLVGHHHTYTGIDGMDYQVLVEADFLVNIYEHPMDAAAIENAKNKIFKTPTGLKFLELMFL